VKAPPEMIAVRSSEGRLLFRMTADGRQIEVVHRRRRYTVALASVGVQPVVFVIAEVVEEDNKKELT
jgi:hypothetical protein